MPKNWDPVLQNKKTSKNFTFLFFKFLVTVSSPILYIKCTALFVQVIVNLIEQLVSDKHTNQTICTKCVFSSEKNAIELIKQMYYEIEIMLNIFFIPTTTTKLTVIFTAKEIYLCSALFAAANPVIVDDIISSLAFLHVYIIYQRRWLNNS